MQISTARYANFLDMRTLVAWTLLLLCGFAGQASAALSVSPNTVALSAGTYVTARISGGSGQIQAETSNTAVATVSVSNGSNNSAILNIFGNGPGGATVTVRDANSRIVSVAVMVAGSNAMTVSPTSLTIVAKSNVILTASKASGTLGASSSATSVATVAVKGNVVTVYGIAPGSVLVSVKDSKTTVNVPVTVTATSGASTSGVKFSLLAWNDLGMHCMDGKDYSMFSILPPYNNLHAQLVNASTGKAVTSGVTLTYEAVADPTGSINTSSAGKTNFWTWSKVLYGASPAPNVGLTGNPVPSLVAKPMALDAVNGWFEATALPMTPYDDSGAKNYYPTVKVIAKDATGKVLASTVTVLPVSDEITCAACHASRPITETNKARLAAKPIAGWVNDRNLEIDWKKNILRLHDEKQAGNAKYLAALSSKGMTNGLYASALAGTPTLCASCHASNALPGTGVTGISTLTSALHTRHSSTLDPTNLLTLDSSTNRNSCYLCHPGSVTKCLRGAMGNAVDANGNATMGCQSCHGNMTKVGNPTRVGWLQEPNCQACHFNGKRTTSAVDAAGNLVKPTDTRFATTPDAPSKGFSLFRFSKGHGNMQCESCHGATHAEYPSSHVNDNLQSIALQGYAGTVRECTVCHTTVPITVNGGPHGMHTIGSSWVSQHGDMIGSSGTTNCAACHGTDYRGSPLSQTKVSRTFSIEGRTLNFAAGQNIGCYDCHNGPRP